MATRHRKTAGRKSKIPETAGRRRMKEILGLICVIWAVTVAFSGLAACGLAGRNPETETGTGESLPTETQAAEETENPQDEEGESRAETRAEEPREPGVIPSRFDLREELLGLSAPDQGSFRTCWAFAALKALETALPEELRTELAADHMSLKNSFGLPVSNGGDYSIAAAYLLAWQGPVPAESDPYGDGETPDNMEPVCHVQGVQMPEAGDREAIKRAILMYGGVQSSIYMPVFGDTEWERFYREETCSYYYDGTRKPDHDVVIVGWDDDWPAENFAREPEENGAYLCMNTWGGSFGDNGFFYVSYEDARIGTYNAVYTTVEDTDNFGNLYQTDLCGWTGHLGYGTEEAWFANVYRAEKNSFIRAAGFYAVAPDTEYRIYTEKLPDEEAENMKFDSRKLAAEGILKEKGFYTVWWENPVWVRKGERFAVIVEIRSPGVAEPVAIEYRAGERTRNVDISDGEGYISFDGKQWQRAETTQNCNVCLKAYGD